MKTSIQIIGDETKKPMGKHLVKKIKKSDKDTDPVILTSPLKITPEVKSKIKSAFKQGSLIGVTDANRDDIETLYKILEFNKTAGIVSSYVDFFAIKKESDGLREFVLHPPPDVYGVSQELYHTNADGGNTVSKWHVGTIRMFDTDQGQEARALKIGELIDDMHHNELKHGRKVTADNGSNELVDLAMAFKHQDMYTVGVLDFNKKVLYNYYQVSSFVYACHCANDNSDWFLAYQIGQFSPSNGFFKNDRLQRLWYVDNYAMNAYPTSFKGDNNTISLIQTSPSTTIGETSVTSSVSFSLSGTVSFEGKSGGGSVTAGMEISNSTTVNIPDVAVYNKSVDDRNNAKWSFIIPKVTGKDDGCINDLNEIVAIAHNTFQPYNQWIWRADPRARASSSELWITSQFFVEQVNTYIGDCNIFGCNCDVNHQLYAPYPNSVNSNFSVPFPPLS